MSKSARSSSQAPAPLPSVGRLCGDYYSSVTGNPYRVELQGGVLRMMRLWCYCTGYWGYGDAEWHEVDEEKLQSQIRMKSLVRYENV